MYYLKFSDFYFSQKKKYSTINSSGKIKNLSDEISFSIPREISQRGFSFSPLQYLALNQIYSFENPSTVSPTFKTPKIGIYLGSESGGFQEYFKQGKRFYQKGIKRVSPMTIPRTIHNTGSAVLAINQQLEGASAGYNGDESIGLVTFLDSILALDAKDQDVMIFGAGEEAQNINATVLGLVSKNQLDNSFAVSLSFSLGRGKPWLSEKQNKADLLNCAKDSLGELPEKTFWFHREIDSFEKDIHLDNYCSVMPELKSIGPVLGLEYCLNCSKEFVYIVTSTDGFGIILVIQQH